jgi:uncharacterized ParB-like nuclease family protein
MASLVLVITPTAACTVGGAGVNTHHSPLSTYRGERCERLRALSSTGGEQISKQQVRCLPNSSVLVDWCLADNERPLERPLLRTRYDATCNDFITYERS